MINKRYKNTRSIESMRRMVVFNPVNNLKEMEESMQDSLSKGMEEAVIEEENLQRTYIKTFMIESNQNINNIKLPEELSGSSITDTDDKNLKLVKIPNEGKTEINYLDISNARFWLLHTSSESRVIRNFVKTLITKNHSLLDFSWFPSSFLEEKCNFGKGNGFHLKYRNNFFRDEIEELVENSKEINYLKEFSMLFWGGRPNDILKSLRNNTELVSGITLTQIKQIFNTKLGYINENIGNSGIFTLTKGDSIPTYFLSINKVREGYTNVINKIEKEYMIKLSRAENRLNIEGTYAVIELKKPIENFELFIKGLFSTVEPFRLFGLPEVVEKDFIKVSAVDLHTNDKLNFEITPDYIRVFLYENACGNVLTRLITNLQLYYDSRITLVGYDNERLI